MTFGHSTSGYWKLAPFGDRRLLAKLEYIINNNIKYIINNNIEYKINNNIEYIINNNIKYKQKHQPTMEKKLRVASLCVQGGYEPKNGEPIELHLMQ